MTKEFQYHGKEGGASWRLLITNYLLSQIPAMEALLRSAESLDDEPATLHTLVNRGLGVSPDTLQKLSRDLWGFLNLNMQGSARDRVNNSTPLEGFALWQRIVKAIRSRNEIRRHELFAKVQRPEMASNLREMLVALERWETLYRDCLESGGRKLSFEKKRSALLTILPVKFREEIFFRVPAMQEDYNNADESGQEAAFADLKMKVQKQAETLWVLRHLASHLAQPRSLGRLSR